ncbi:hypothetical protein BGX38DRAFT_1083192, partial [Terfezia claveryi]
HRGRVASLSNLRQHLSSRYERTGNLQDLEAAIARKEAAMQAAPEYHPDIAGILTNLGIHLNSRYERSGNLQDLEASAAIALSSAAEPALCFLPQDHPIRARMLGTLGRHLSTRYDPE